MKWCFQARPSKTFIYFTGNLPKGTVVPHLTRQRLTTLDFSFRMAARNPNVLWAQMSDKVFLTLDIQEAEKPVVNLTNHENTGNISFK
jgi:hypothetical protein